MRKIFHPNPCYKKVFIFQKEKSCQLLRVYRLAIKRISAQLDRRR